MSELIPKLVFLQLNFRTLQNIQKLPYFHGAQWSTLWRLLIKAHYPPDTTLAQKKITIHPTDTGLISYSENEPIHLGLTFPIEESRQIAQVLGTFNNYQCSYGHFQPGKTIILDSAYCRICGNRWSSDDTCFLTDTLITDEIHALLQHNEWTIKITTPLRLTRPEGIKGEGHRYCDEDYFLLPEESYYNPLKHFIEKINQSLVPESFDLKITGGALTWIDVPYGSEDIKTIGGIVGEIHVQGIGTIDVARSLVLGQYLGLGKNSSFGFGCYTIPELDESRKIKRLCRGSTIPERIMTAESHLCSF